MIYLDNAATTKVYNDIIHLIQYYDVECFFNPSTSYKKSVQVRQEIEKARSGISTILGCKSKEVFFTSGGTEGNNQCVFGSAKNKTQKLVTCESEHASVLKPFIALKNSGYNVSITQSNRYAGIDEDALLKAIDSETAFVSIMQVNNETGYINDIRTLSKEIKKRNSRCLIHVDGVQGFCKQFIDMYNTGIDMYTFSGHKIGAVKGVGGVFVRSGVNIRPLMYGGGQEGDRRSGTENVAGIIALNTAAQKPISFECYKKTVFECLQKGLSDIVLNSPIEKTADNILNVSIKNVKGEILQNYLQEDDIYIGLGSACSTHSKSDRISKVFELGANYLEGTIRISFFHEYTQNDLLFASERICHYSKKIREVRA